MTTQKIKREAKAFCIWREGVSVKWDCTVTELSEATGISRPTVEAICSERGWPVQDGDKGGRPFIDLPFIFGRQAHNHSHGRSAYHV